MNIELNIVTLIHFLSYLFVFSICYYFLNKHFSKKGRETRGSVLTSLLYSILSFSYLWFFFSEGRGILNALIPLVFLIMWGLNKSTLNQKGHNEALYAAVVPSTLFFIAFRNITNTTGFFRMENAFTLIGVTAILLLFIAQYFLIQVQTKKDPPKAPQKSALYFCLFFSTLFIGLLMLRDQAVFRVVNDFFYYPNLTETLRVLLGLIVLLLFFYLNSLIVQKLYKYEGKTSRKIAFEMILANIGLTLILGFVLIITVIVASLLTGGLFNDDQIGPSWYSKEIIEESGSKMIDVELFEEMDYRLGRTIWTVELWKSNGIFFKESEILLDWDHPDALHFDIVRVNGVEYTFDEIPLRETY
jgi:Mn2+/Fe2+ NRAMP family transporter